MPPKKTDSAAAPLDFEGAMKRLETIVEELESGELSLEDSIARYEEGIKLSRALTARLDDAEKRIERLAENDAGDPVTQPMELELEGGKDSAPGELPF